jgi:lambda family phage tail tape measure protein
MASLVASGVIAGSALGASTEAVANFAKQTGQSAEDATAAMIKFAEDPAKALDVLVTKYHEFDGAQVAIIQKYLDAGDKAAAYAKEVEFINDAHTKFGKEGVDNVGYVAAAWDYLAKTAHGAMNELNAFGAATSDSVKLADAISAQTSAQLNFNRAVSQGPAFSARAKLALDAATVEVNAIQQVTAAREAAQKANAARAASGTAELNTNAFLKKYQSTAPADVRNQEKSEAKTAFDALSKDSPSYQQALIAYHERIKEIDDKYAKSTKTRSVSPNAGINAQLATIAGQNKLIEDEEKRSQTRLKALKDLGVIDADDYYQQLHDIQSKALTAEIANAQQRADVAGGKKEQAAHETALAEVTKLTAQRKSLDDDLNDALAKSAQQRNDIIRRYGDTAASAYRDQLAGYKESFDTKDMLPIEKASYDARATMLATFVKNQESVESAYKSHSIDLATRNAELAISQDTYDKQRAALEANLKQEQAIRDSYGDQAHHALIQLAGESQSNAQLAATAFTTAWGDASNALDTFVTTGKGSFSDFTSSVLADMAKIALHAAESQIFSSIAGSSFFSDGGTVGHFASGGNISGPGSGTSDSIPAMLSNGEYIVRATQAKKYGSLLESINSGRMSHYASGGAVGSVPAGGGSGDKHEHKNTFNLQSGGLTQQDVVALLPQLQTVIDKRISQRFGGQGGLAWKMKYNQI